MSVWPTGQLYTEVVQNPRWAFKDSLLQSGQVETDRLQLPKPRAGNLAVVYKIDCAGKSWAIKCFTREVPDRQRRYSSISSHLRAVKLPYTVGFEYLPQGIHVSGSWFPLLKMEWVSGDPLIQYVEKHLHESSFLLKLASQWIEMVTALRSARVSHGDLQHGNVIVVGDQIKLVDYDGMFVPDLLGTPATEHGHPNYQHPGRSSMLFGLNLDNFSSWTVYVSLIALSIDPTLWKLTDAGDDCLLFRAQDFVLPDTARVFRLLATRDQQLRCLVDVYRELLRLRADQVPPLDAPKFILEAAQQPAQTRAGSWLEDHRAGPTTAIGTPRSQQSSFDASWVLDFVTPQVPLLDARFVRSAWPLRLLAASWTAVAFVSAAPTNPALWSLMAFSAILYIVVLIGRYRSEPGVLSLKPARTKLTKLEERLRQKECLLYSTDAAKSEREEKRDRDIADLNDRLRMADERAKRETDAVNARLARRLAATQENREKIRTEELAAKAMIAQGVGARATELKTRLASAHQDWTDELATALKEIQDEYVQNELLRAHLSRASIMGLGPRLQSALTAHGFNSAFDVYHRTMRIRGIGPVRTKAIHDWANRQELRARTSMPQSLPAPEERRIYTKYSTEQQSVILALNATEQQLRSEETSIKAKFELMYKELDNLDSGHRSAGSRELQAIQTGVDQEKRALAIEEERVTSQAKNELSSLEARIAVERKGMLSLQWETAQAATRVKSCVSLSFARYLRYVAFGL